MKHKLENKDAEVAKLTSLASNTEAEAGVSTIEVGQSNEISRLSITIDLTLGNIAAMQERIAKL